MSLYWPRLVLAAMIFVNVQVLNDSFIYSNLIFELLSQMLKCYIADLAEAASRVPLLVMPL